MSTSTLAPEARRNAALFMMGDLAGQKPKMYRKFKKSSDESKNGVEVLVVEGVAVFRSGVFRDSMGYQHTWEAEHMQQMIDNFDILQTRGIFTDVPVRSGHPGWLISGTEGTGKVVGWHTGLRLEERKNPSDGANYTYLLADFEILDEDAKKNIESTLWRKRSAEVGSYVTNSEAEYWPVYQGFAYVDIPAVEGLDGFSRHAGVGVNYSIMTENEKEIPVVPTTDEGQESSTPVNTGEGGTAPDAEQTPPVQAPATTGDETQGNGADAPQPTGGQPVEEREGQHRSQTATSFTFMVGGQPTTDFARVQAHITALESAHKAASEQARRDFVAGLVSSNRILATQEEVQREFALGLTDEQYSQFVKTWEAAPEQPLLGRHAGNTTGGDGTVSTEPSEIETLEETLKYMRKTMKAEAVEKTPQFQRLQMLKKSTTSN